MYCRKCGIELNADQAFCGRCGEKVSAGPAETVYLREKSAGVAAVLSLLWAGLGQVYVGKIGLGLLLIIVFPMILSISLVFMILTVNLVGLLLFSIILFVVWIWNIFNAYDLAKEYNDRLRSTGRHPW